jgi:hypothetical protein
MTDEPNATTTDPAAVRADCDRAAELDAASPKGPWVADPGRPADQNGAIIVRGVGSTDYVAWVYWEPNRAARAAFIAESRTLLPRLAAHCRGLLAENERLRATENRGLMDQCRHMAEAAAEAIGQPFDETSPNDIRQAVAALTAERDSLAHFKQYVHARLDAAGVSPDPESPHKAEGCRIGGRLDEVLGERDKLRAENEDLRANLDWAGEPEVVAGCELDLLRKRVAELEAALKPFASVPVHPMAGDDTQAALSVVGNRHDWLTAGQIRRAAALLAAKPEGGA